MSRRGSWSACVVAPSARRSVAPLHRTPVSKSSLGAYPRVLPRLRCISEINAPDLDLFIDISTEHMRKLEHSTAADPDDPEVAAVIAEDQAEDEDADSDDEEET